MREIKNEIQTERDLSEFFNECEKDLRDGNYEKLCDPTIFEKAKAGIHYVNDCGQLGIERDRNRWLMLHAEAQLCLAATNKECLKNPSLLEGYTLPSWGAMPLEEAADHRSQFIAGLWHLERGDQNAAKIQFKKKAKAIDSTDVFYLCLKHCYLQRLGENPNTWYLNLNIVTDYKDMLRRYFRVQTIFSYLKCLDSYQSLLKPENSHLNFRFSEKMSDTSIKINAVIYDALCLLKDPLQLPIYFRKVFLEIMTDDWLYHLSDSKYITIKARAFSFIKSESDLNCIVGFNFVTNDCSPELLLQFIKSVNDPALRIKALLSTLLPNMILAEALNFGQNSDKAHLFADQLEKELSNIPTEISKLLGYLEVITGAKSYFTILPNAGPLKFGYIRLEPSFCQNHPHLIQLLMAYRPEAFKCISQKLFQNGIDLYKLGGRINESLQYLNQWKNYADAIKKPPFIPKIELYIYLALNYIALGNFVLAEETLLDAFNLRLKFSVLNSIALKPIELTPATLQSFNLEFETLTAKNQLHLIVGLITSAKNKKEDAKAAFKRVIQLGEEQVKKIKGVRISEIQDISLCAEIELLYLQQPGFLKPKSELEHLSPMQLAINSLKTINDSLTHDRLLNRIFLFHAQGEYDQCIKFIKIKFDDKYLHAPIPAMIGNRWIELLLDAEVGKKTNIEIPVTRLFKSKIYINIIAHPNSFTKAKALISALLFKTSILGKIFSTGRNLIGKPKLKDERGYLYEIAQSLEYLLKENDSLLTNIRYWLNQQSNNIEPSRKQGKEGLSDIFPKIYEKLFGTEITIPAPPTSNAESTSSAASSVNPLSSAITLPQKLVGDEKQDDPAVNVTTLLKAPIGGVFKQPPKNGVTSDEPASSHSATTEPTVKRGTYATSIDFPLKDNRDNKHPDQSFGDEKDDCAYTL